MFPIKEDLLAPAGSFTMREPLYEDVAPPSALGQFIDGFRRDPTQRITPKDPLNELHDAEAAQLYRPILARHGPSGSHYYDLRLATLQTAQSHLARKLKGRHLQMIAIGGSIGMRAARWLKQAPLISSPRNWSIRHIWPCPRVRRAGFGASGLFDHRHHVILYRPGAGRVGCLVSRCRLLFRLLNPLPPPLLGICHGLEVRCFSPPSPCYSTLIVPLVTPCNGLLLFPSKSYRRRLSPRTGTPI